MDGFLTPAQSNAYERALPVHQVSGIGSAAGSSGLDDIPTDGISIIGGTPED